MNSGGEVLIKYKTCAVLSGMARSKRRKVSLPNVGVNNQVSEESIQAVTKLDSEKGTKGLKFVINNLLVNPNIVKFPVTEIIKMLMLVSKELRKEVTAFKKDVYIGSRLFFSPMLYETRKKFFNALKTRDITTFTRLENQTDSFKNVFDGQSTAFKSLFSVCIETYPELLKDLMGCIRSLNFLWKNIGPKGARAIGEALKVNTTLTSLRLGWNGIRAEGRIALTNAGFSFNLDEGIMQRSTP